MGAVVTGWGTSLPRTELTNEELAQRLGISAQWIFERTGIRSRRVVGEGETSSSLAIAASRGALAQAHCDAADVDYVIVATCTPDYQMPAAAALVQHALGASRAAAFDLNAACSGFLFALAQANALIEAGSARRVLVCGADILTTVTDYTDPRSSVIFGDGAGAALVEGSEGLTRLGPFRLGTDGAKPELLWIPPETGRIRMEGREVYRRAVEGMTRSVRSVLAEAGVTVDEVDLLVAHQANARILEAVAHRLAVPSDRVALNIARLGNTSAASVPIAVSEAAQQGLLKDGDLVVLTAFGAGFTWGTGLLRWSPPVGDVEAPLEASGAAVDLAPEAPAFAGEARG
jgi:3-oxoacyl-[acyl-carrier-protein] synthase III